jgi:hypothetical protein
MGLPEGAKEILVISFDTDSIAPWFYHCIYRRFRRGTLYLYLVLSRHYDY